MSDPRSIVRGLTLVLALAATGCRMPRSAYEPKAQFPSIEHPPPVQTPVQQPQTPATPANFTVQHEPVNTTADVMAEVQRLGRTNPQAQQALLEQLARAETSMWPQVVQVFRSSMAYAQQSATRDPMIAQQPRPSAQHAYAAPKTAAQPISYSTLSQQSVVEEPRGRLLPPPGESALLMARYATELADRYPSTNLPQVRLASTDSGETENTQAPAARASAATAAPDPTPAADLAVRNLAFCTEITSYGVYKPFDPYQFQPGQETLLYAEVENFTSEQTAKGFHTALRSRYEILDSRGSAVAQQDFALTEEYCRNQRRDFFIRYFLHIPSALPAGEYTLKLTIDDAKSGKIGAGKIQFRISD